MGPVVSSAYGEALRTVADELVPHGPEAEAPHGVGGRCGLLTGFTEIAVVDHTGARPRVVVAEGTEITHVLALEWATREGPSTEAASTGETVVCRDLAHERRWADLTARLHGRFPLRRWAAVPFGIPGEECAGSLVVAAPDPGVVRPDEILALTSMATRSSLALTAHVAACRETRAVLATDRVRVISLAVGVLMEAEGLPEPLALDELKRRSRHSGRRLVETAATLVARHDARLAASSSRRP